MFSLKMANLFFLADKLTSILFECVFTSVLVRGPEPEPELISVNQTHKKGNISSAVFLVIPLKICISLYRNPKNGLKF